MKISKADAARLNGKKGGRPRKSGEPKPVAPPVSAPPQCAAPPVDNPFKLTPKELLFVEAYCGAARFSAAEAYKMASYDASGKGWRANASKLLSKDRVAAAIAERLEARVRLVRGSVMDGDEAIERLSLYARADIGKVLDPDDPLAQLPDEIRLCIKSVRPSRFGRTIELYDAMKATELMGKAAGRLVEKHEHTGKLTLEQILDASRGDGAQA